MDCSAGRSGECHESDFPVCLVVGIYPEVNTLVMWGGLSHMYYEAYRLLVR